MSLSRIARRISLPALLTVVLAAVLSNRARPRHPGRSFATLRLPVAPGSPGLRDPASSAGLHDTAD
jgi:hypothetical protein